MKIKNIIALTDFSDSSTNAALYAANLLQEGSLNVTLVNVDEKPVHKAAMLISFDDILGKSSEIELKKQTEQLTYLFNNDKISIATYSGKGDLKKIINSFAGHNEVQLIVSGMPSLRGLPKSPLLFLGRDKCPILLVPDKCSFKPLEEIVFVHNGSSGQPSIGKTFINIIPRNEMESPGMKTHDRNIENITSTVLQTIISEYGADMAVIIPTPGNKTDMAILDYRIKDLIPPVDSILINLN